jgi:VIT1/CCC1 family predicted Fe2+/Mn2+ transporter
MKSETVNTTHAVTVTSLIEQSASATPAPADPKALKPGAVLHKETVDLGMGHSAGVEIKYAGHHNALPDYGAEWDISLDYAAAILTITLQRSGISGDLRSNVSVLEEDVRDIWGQDKVGGGRYRSLCHAEPSLAASIAALKARAASDLGELRAHVAARAARIAKRHATLASGLDI